MLVAEHTQDPGPRTQDWKHLTFYGVILLLALAVGAEAIWSFVTRQSLVILPDPIPRVAVVTGDPRSPLAAAWVSLLTRAQMQPTLVAPDKLNPIEGVVVVCDIPVIPPQLNQTLASFLQRGGTVVIAGMPPASPIGRLQLTADVGQSDSAMKFSDAPSPVLARLTPGYEVQVHPTAVAMLRETPQMIVDARWKGHARAVVMHMEDHGGRYVWFGLDPNALALAEDPQLLLLLRTTFRWAAGQPVSDGAVGGAPLVAQLAPAARQAARSERFAFSAERMSNPKVIAVQMVNRGGAPLTNPTVKVWLPPGVREVSLAGDFITRRDVTLTGQPEEGACVVSVPLLRRNEERIVQLSVR